MRGLLNAFMGPTRVYSALSSSDFWISGKSNPFPGGRRRLYCYNVSLRFETGTLTVRKSRRGLSPVVTDERDSHIAMKVLMKPVSRPLGSPLMAFWRSISFAPSICRFHSIPSILLI